MAAGGCVGNDVRSVGSLRITRELYVDVATSKWMLDDVDVEEAAAGEDSLTTLLLRHRGQWTRLGTS